MEAININPSLLSHVNSALCRSLQYLSAAGHPKYEALLCELGCLPVSLEVAFRQLCFMHHLYNCPSSWLVHRVFRFSTLSEPSDWCTKVSALLTKFHIPFSTLSLSPLAFKQLARRAVQQSALDTFTSSCRVGSSASILSYVKSSYDMPIYLTELADPLLIGIIWRLRLGTLPVAEHLSRFPTFLPPHCILCSPSPPAKESLYHLLLSCPLYIPQRSALDRALREAYESSPDVRPWCNLWFDRPPPATKRIFLLSGLSVGDVSIFERNNDHSLAIRRPILTFLRDVWTLRRQKLKAIGVGGSQLLKLSYV